MRRHRFVFLAGLPLLAGLVTHAAAQTLGLASDHDIPVWRIVAALVFCCLLGAAGAVALQYRLRSGKPIAKGAGTPEFRHLLAAFKPRLVPRSTDGARLRLVDTVQLSHQVHVALLECDGAAVLLVTTPQGAFVVNPASAGQEKTS